MPFFFYSFFFDYFSVQLSRILNYPNIFFQPLFQNARIIKKIPYFHYLLIFLFIFIFQKLSHIKVKMVLLRFFLLVSFLATFASSVPLCQPSNACQVSNATLRCSNLTSSQSLFIKYCPNLGIKSLDLSGNNISRIIKTYEETNTSQTEIRESEWLEVQINADFLSQLERIDLTHNQFHSFPLDLANSQTLKVLNLSFNKINKMNKTLKMDALTSLHLHNNELEKLEDYAFENCPNLQELDLSGNKLKTLKNLKLKSIKMMNVSKNLIYNTEPNAFQSCTKLQILDLSDNLQTRITKSIFDGLQSSLLQLDLSKNKLTKIFSDAFSELEQLEKLNLGQNPSIKSINHIIFPYHLKLLELNNNSLQELDECSFKHLKDIEYLNLGSNPLSCNCHIYRIFISFGSKLYTNQNSTCRNLTNDQITEVPIKSLNPKCYSHNCRSHRTASERFSKLNITISAIDISIKIKWRTSLKTQLFLLQINDSSKKEVLKKYINYDREYEFESSNSFMSYKVCIAAVNEQKEIIQRTCDYIYISDKNIIIGISAGVIALLPCVVLLVYIGCKDKQYTMKLLTEAPEDKVLISKKRTRTNGVKKEKHNQGFEHEDSKNLSETLPQDIPPTQENLGAKSQSSSTHL